MRHVRANDIYETPYWKGNRLKRDFTNLKTEKFDLIIIGGGIIGTGAARDAALRGLRTLLVEREDFSYGTTSRSTRLIHGGLRYLRMLDFKLVRQDLKEREILLKIAPHLVHRLEFVIPLLRSEPYYRLVLPVGLRLYNILSHGTSLPACHHLSASETLKFEPSLQNTEGLTGAFIYYDGQAEYTERLCIENVLDAAGKDATILNHALMTKLLQKDGTVSGIQVKDALTGEEYQANGRLVLNTAGPWADLVWQKLGAGFTEKIRKTKGIHLLTRKLAKSALVLFAKSDGRLFFVVPWLDFSLIGTTDTDYTGDLDELYADKSDVEYLVSEMQHYFPDFKKDDIYFTMAGLRALVPKGNKAQSNTSRAHKLVDHERRDGIKGFLSIIGGKNTAYRGIAEEAVDLVCKKLNRPAACSTAHTPLPGAPVVSQQYLDKAAQEGGLPPETVAHLAAIYGSRFASVLKYAAEDKRLGNPISSGARDILAQVKHAVLEETALSVNDFMLRRSFIGLGQSQGLDAVETVAKEMGALLGWSGTEIQQQTGAYRAVAALGQHYRE
jgi:glycerol-3-phosphate dehydrogenase